MPRKRPTCGRWLRVDGRRVTCTFNYGHDGDCKPLIELREAERRRRLRQLSRQQ